MGGCISINTKKPRKSLFQSLHVQPLTVHGLPSELIKELNRGLTLDHSNKDIEADIMPSQKFVRHKDDYDCMFAKILDKTISAKDVENIKQAITDHFLFRGLGEDIVEELIYDMHFYSLERNEVICRQGDPGYNFFMIGSGVVEIIVTGKRVKTLERGQGFGELALLYYCERKAKVVSVTRTTL